MPNHDDAALVLSLKKELEEKDRELLILRESLNAVKGRLAALGAEVQHQQHMMSQLQKFLAPTEIPQFAGMEISSKFFPGAQRGGDYFDIFQHEDAMKFGILLASSSGYAMSALFLSVLIQFTGRMEARKGLGPDQLLKSLAKEMQSQIAEADSTSLFYGIFDRRNYTLSFSSMGCMMGYFQKAGKGRLTKLEPSAGPLTRSARGMPLVQDMSMGAYDRLFLVSRGVIEAQDKSGSSFGFDRLNAAVEAAPKNNLHDVRNEILFHVQKFTDEKEVAQDQTVIVLEIKDRVIKLV